MSSLSRLQEIYSTIENFTAIFNSLCVPQSEGTSQTSEGTQDKENEAPGLPSFLQPSTWHLPVDQLVPELELDRAAWDDYDVCSGPGMLVSRLLASF